MNGIRLIAAAASLVCLGSSAMADAPLIYCTGSGCSSNGLRIYAYTVDSVSYPMMEFRVGTNDLNPSRYTNVLAPPGWQFALEATPMHHDHGVHTPHGQLPTGPCWCMTVGSARWWTDDPQLAVEDFTFGYDHPWPSEDVAWELTTRREGPPPEWDTFQESWDDPVGWGTGPVHGPWASNEPCWSNQECDADHYCFSTDCGATIGVCIPRPASCSGTFVPVCGCDGITYTNACHAAMAGVNVAYNGACVEGDVNRDGYVDLVDYAMFSACMNGPGGGVPAGCDDADLDHDDDIDLGDFQIFQIAFGLPASPRVEGYSNSGCLPGTHSSPGGWYPCGEDQIEFTVVGAGTLRVLHLNAAYNCCLDDIVISLTIEPGILRLTEEEILTDPCYCICCYDVEATVVDLAPGEYTVELCWWDYDSWDEECYTDTVVIP